MIIVTNVNQSSSIIHRVKKVAQAPQLCILEHQLYFSISECNCNPDGSKTLECGRTNGYCSCKERVSGLKCDDCMHNHFNFPLCQGMFQQLFF